MLAWLRHGPCVLKQPWWWHSSMNQRLNHFVLLHKCNCIRIVSIDTYNKNVDIIWHYCHIPYSAGFWRWSALTNIKKDALKYMINRLWYGIFYIIPPYIKLLDFHWIKAMLFFRKYYDFLQFFLHHGIFFPAILNAVVFFRNTTAGGKIPCLEIDRD